MAEDFAGRIALVTGGGNGIGAATCRAFAAAGAQVAIVDRDMAAAEAVAVEITRHNGNAAAHGLDVVDRDAFARLAEAVNEAWGGVDILVNGAGTTIRRMIGEMGAEDWNRVIAVNLTGAFNGIQAVLPHMRARGGGAIVNVSSISALRPRGLTAYSTSKGAVIALTRAMAVDHGPDGIRVNCVAPGPVYTPMVYSRQMTAAGREARRKASVLGIEGTGWDIGLAVRFLLSAQARYITGQTLVVDGGATLVGPARVPD
jgi:NAD(P)-dependent dehydrogenase (short-subunit alcohol dehydrogenase family)